MFVRRAKDALALTVLQYIMHILYLYEKTDWITEVDKRMQERRGRNE
jgi:hypothetical protein